MGKLVAQVAGGGGVSEAQPSRLRTRLESLADYVPHQHSPWKSLSSVFFVKNNQQDVPCWLFLWKSMRWLQYLRHNVRPRFSQVHLTHCQTIWKGEKKQQKPGKAGARFAKAGKVWQGLGNAAKAAEKLGRISQHQFSGVKLIE